MKKQTWIFLLLFSSVLGWMQTSYAQSKESVKIREKANQYFLNEIVQQQINPNYENFIKSVDEFNASIVCDNENISYKKEFEALLDAWGKVSILRIKPILVDNRLLKLESYPIRKNFILKKLNGYFSQQKMQSDNKSAIKNQSVVLQGLPALEFINYQSLQLSNKDKKQHCLLKKKIGLHIKDTIKVAFEDWSSDLKNQYLRVAADKDSEALVDDFVNAIMAGLTEISIKRIDIKQLNINGEKAISEMPWAYSGQQIMNVDNMTLASIKYLSNVDYYSVDDLLNAIGYGGVALRLKNYIEQVENLIKADNIKDANYLIELQARIKTLQQFIETTVYASLNISRDFNATDGD